MTYQQNWWGFVPLILGSLMFKGLKTATPSPKKVWLITFFGKRTMEVVRDWPILVLDWIPLKPVGYVEFELGQKDKDFTFEKPILCCDGKYVSGKISVSMVVDDTDGETLADFDDIGRMEGVIAQLDDIFPSWLQEIANEEGHDSKWMETKGLELTDILLKHIEGEIGTTKNKENSDMDDIRGFGIKFKKFQPLLQPPPKIIDARNEKAIEEANRIAEVFETETINAQILLRFKLYNGEKTMKECREEVFDERVMKGGKYQKIVNTGGINVANVGDGSKGK